MAVRECKKVSHGNADLRRESKSRKQKVKVTEEGLQKKERLSRKEQDDEVYKKWGWGVNGQCNLIRTVIFGVLL